MWLILRILQTATGPCIPVDLIKNSLGRFLAGVCIYNLLVGIEVQLSVGVLLEQLEYFVRIILMLFDIVEQHAGVLTCLRFTDLIGVSQPFPHLLSGRSSHFFSSRLRALGTGCRPQS